MAPAQPAKSKGDRPSRQGNERLWDVSRPRNRRPEYSRRGSAGGYFTRALSQDLKHSRKERPGAGARENTGRNGGSRQVEAQSQMISTVLGGNTIRQPGRAPTGNRARSTPGGSRYLARAYRPMGAEKTSSPTRAGETKARLTKRTPRTPPDFLADLRFLAAFLSSSRVPPVGPVEGPKRGATRWGL